MIEVKNIHLKSILDSVSFSFKEGSICMLVGPNGCGKTTLLKTMVGLYEPDKGTISYQEQNLSKMDVEQRASIFSFIPQMKTIPETMTVLECVLAGKMRFLFVFSMPDAKMITQAEQVLAYCQILHLKDRFLDTLSGGELQLVYLARSLMQDARVLIMDEPCSYLDLDKQILFLQLIEKLKKAGKTVFISMHDPNLAIRYADQIVYMNLGRIVASIDRSCVDFKEKCVCQYNRLFGNCLLYNKEADFLYWG